MRRGLWIPQLLIAGLILGAALGPTRAADDATELEWARLRGRLQNLPLVENLIARSPQLAEAKAFAAQLAAQACPRLSALVTDRTASPRERTSAAYLLGELGDPAAVPALLAVQTEEAAVAAAAGAALGRLDDPRIVPGLVEIYRREPEESPAAQTVLRTLGNLRKVASSSQLTGLLSAPELPVRRAAAQALGNCGDDTAMPALKAALADANPGVARQAAVSLARIDLDGRYTATLQDFLEHRCLPIFRAELADEIGLISRSRVKSDDLNSGLKTRLAQRQAADKVSGRKSRREIDPEFVLRQIEILRGGNEAQKEKAALSLLRTREALALRKDSYTVQTLTDLDLILRELGIDPETGQPISQ